MRSLSGVLAVVIASPCTAPFMGAALGFALASRRRRRSPCSSRWASAWRCRSCCSPGSPDGGDVLPRPGPWMERLKQVLAFPLYATVAWLAWVLGAQVDNDAVLRLLVDAGRRRRSRCGRGARIAAAAAARSASRRSSRSRVAVVVAWPLFAATPVASGDGARDGRRRERRPRWQPFTPAPRRRAHRAGTAGVRRLHRGVVRDLPGEQAARAERRRRPRGVRANATSRWCAPTGRGATPRSRRRSPRWAAAACRCTCCTGPARNRCCCRRSCSRSTVQRGAGHALDGAQCRIVQY